MSLETVRTQQHHTGLIILVIQAVIEVIIFYDVITDMLVAAQAQLHKVAAKGNIYGEGLFVTCVIFIISPYFIAWSAITQASANKLKEYPDSIMWKILVVCYDIAPIGIALLLLNDIYHLIECFFIKPIFYIVTGGKQFRNISFEELGYYKLRRVSEIFAESLPQALLQAFILSIKNQSKDFNDVSTFGVVMALFSSVIVLIFWGLILFVEASNNGMALSEYVPVVFRGSFSFVPFLPAIERGTKNGDKVNWTYFKMNSDTI